MKEGFYIYEQFIYYGNYHEEQVANKWKMSQNTLEKLKTDHPIGEDDDIVRLWENHSLLEVEYENLQKMLLTMRRFMSLNTQENLDFSAIEERLNIVFPRELKKIYTAIQNREEYFMATEHFLSLDELYIDQEILVFFKKKRNPVAGYDLRNGRLVRYYKKEWEAALGDICCYQFCIGRMITIALEHKLVVKKGRCKGDFVTTLDINKELEHFCDKKYHLLLDFNVYGIAVMYSDDGLIAWIRSNGFYADIHAGADDAVQLENLCKHLGNIVWKE